MKRPYIICHMTTSIDGKVTGDFLSHPDCEAGIELYYEINRSFKPDAYACGRITMEGSFTGGWYPDLAQYPPVQREGDYLGEERRGFYAVAFDPQGRLGWKSSCIEDEDPGYGGAQIIEVVTRRADPRYLSYLEDMGIPYLIAGEEQIDVALALEKLQTCFQINKLLLEGGSVLDGGFQRAGVVDELSLVMVPLTARAEDKPLFWNGVQEQYTLTEAERHGSVIWLRYKK